uniref:Uncharacterized protein n=1 Tax=Brassica oleracea TaxID=3712 RepID=A0A3P6FTV2_BRAOL|nr:unnamed protein product [Brassica oleracea]
MEFTKTSRKKTNGNGGHQVLNDHKRNPCRFSKSTEENEKMVEEMQQQMLELKRKIIEKKVNTSISRLKYNMRPRWIYINEVWLSIEDDPYPYFRLECPKKLELDKVTFANSAYRDKKAVISFSSGRREINIHNLNHRMLHEAQSMDGERRLLKKLNPSKDDDDSWVSFKQIEEEMLKLYRLMKLPVYSHKPSTMDVKECERKLKELELKRDQVFVNAPYKASLWNSIPSTKVLRNQIQDMEAIDEEKRKMVLVRRKEIESEERKIKKAEKEIKSMNKMMEMILSRKQRALETISHEKRVSVVKT